MKTQMYPLLVTALLITSFAMARPVNKVIVNGGNWSATTTWSLVRIPQNGDSVVIPSSFAVKLNLSMSLNNLYINCTSPRKSYSIKVDKKV